MLATDLRYDFVRTAVSDAREISVKALRDLFESMEQEGRKRVAEAGDLADDVEIIRTFDMRYGEQIFEISVSLDNLDGDDLIDRLVAAFHRRHEELYTYSSPEQEVVLVNARLSVVGTMKSIPAEPTVSKRPAAKSKRLRRVCLGGWMDAPVYDMDALGADQRISGPAIVESKTTTILLNQGDSATVTETGWLDILVRKLPNADSPPGNLDGAVLQPVMAGGQ
jgi:N-methylhydantoinase A